MAKILIVEDDLTFSQMLQNFLEKKGHDLHVANTIKQGIKYATENPHDLLLLDYRLPDGTGLDVLAKVREKDTTVPVIIMTSFNDIRTAVKAMRSGAFDYITKPVNPDELVMVIDNALGQKHKEQVQNNLPEFVKGVSKHSDKLDQYINIVSPTNMSVLIQGETGTGKEYVARQIHQQSNRASKPFIAIDCGVLSKELAGSELFGHVKGAFTGAVNDKKGVFEWAEGGTLFMDEIGNLSYEVQMKLLRVLQEKVIQPIGANKQIPVDIRLIAATNDDLLNSVRSNDFRQDLYHRVNEFKIQLSPLRDRENDLPIFIKHFIKQSNIELSRNVLTISGEADEILNRYDWPGNLRELKNVIKRMVLLSPGDTASADTLPDEMLFSVDNHQPEADVDLKSQNEINEKKLIQKTLVDVKYNKSQAARILNIDRKTLYSKIERYGLDS
jgi:two-component system, NtrC family, response regulator HydG